MPSSIASKWVWVTVNSCIIVAMHFIGIIGIVVILALAFLLSNNRKAINYRTVGVGLLIQIVLAIFILKTPIGKSVFGFLGKIVQKLLQF